MITLLAATLLTQNLTAHQKADLLKGPFHILVPTYVPAGYAPTVVKIEDRDKPGEATLILTYANKKKKGEFTIQMGSEGLGDVFFNIGNDGDTVEPNGHLVVKNPILGKVDLDYYVKGKYRLFHCNWVHIPGKTLPTDVMIEGENMTAAEGKKIFESLRWLKGK